jgi:hypothetical protein
MVHELSDMVRELSDYETRFRTPSVVDRMRPVPSV